MQGVAGMPVPMKRQAMDAKAAAGLQYINPATAAAYQQLAYAQASGQPAYVPVSCK